jgi:hypothetical protein
LDLREIATDQKKFADRLARIRAAHGSSKRKSIERLVDANVR